MDSIPLEMDDIFGEDEDVEDFNPSRLPDLEDELEPMRELRNEENDEAENAQDDTDNAELMAKLKGMKGASKHVTRKNLPKLDSNRLTGERGIPVLPKVFKDILLKGKNHEKEDLKLIMQTLEHWAHRLFPKMTFGEVLERTERLGAKKDVQACVKRIRLDMPVLMTDHVQDEDDDDDVQRTGADEKEDSDHRHDDSWKENEIDDEEVEELLREQVLPVDSLFTAQDAPLQPQDAPLQPQEKQTEMKNSLTDELKARIEHNKKLALERRAAKLAEQSQGSKNESSAVNNPTSENEKSDLPEVQAPKDTQHEQLHHDKPGVQSDQLFTADSDSEMQNVADDCWERASENESSTVNNPTSENEKSDLPEVQAPKDTQHEQLHHDKPGVQSDQLFTADSDSEIQDMADDCWERASKNESSAVNNPTSENEKSDLPEVQAPKDTQHEQLHHDKPDVQSDQLFTADSDSEIQDMADDCWERASKNESSAVNNPTSENEKSDLPEVQAPKDTQHEQLHHDKPGVQSDQLFTADSDSEMQNVADDCWERASKNESSAVNNPTSENEKSDLPEVQAPKDTQHEQLHRDKPGVQSDQLFTADSDSEMQDMVADDM